MSIDPMTKMYISLVAMALMFVCNLMIIYARKLQSALIRFVLRTIAFILILAIFVMILIVVFV